MQKSLQELQRFYSASGRKSTVILPQTNLVEFVLFCFVLFCFRPFYV